METVRTLICIELEIETISQEHAQAVAESAARAAARSHPICVRSATVEALAGSQDPA